MGDMSTKKVLVRMPTAMHSELIEHADNQGVSVNTLILVLLAGAIGFKLAKSPSQEGTP